MSAVTPRYVPPLFLIRRRVKQRHGIGACLGALPLAIERETSIMIRKLPSGGYRLYSRKTNPKTGKRRNLGTFKSRAAAQKHERAVQYFKRSG